MKIVVIGDIHGRTIWKEIWEKENPDKIIFVGDYLDTKEDINGFKQLQNFKDILDLKRENHDKVVLLFGNHDYHYLKGHDDHYSGYQGFFAIDFQIAVEKAVKEKLVQACHKEGDFLFVHAGLTKTWCNNQGVSTDPDKIVDEVNKLFIENRLAFAFNPYQVIRGAPSNYGDDVEQGPFWVRQESLSTDMANNLTQVVGHTMMDRIDVRSRIIGIDTLWQGKYLTLTKVGESFLPKEARV